VEIADYWKILRARWISFVAITLIGAAIGFGWASLQPKTYIANASGILSVGVSTELGTALAGENYAKSRIKSYVDLAKSRLVAESVKEKLGLEQSPDELIAAISVTNPVETSTLKVSAEAGSPDAAKQLAEAWIVAIGGQVSSFENADASAGQKSIVNFRSLDAAQRPSFPASPNMKLAVLVGLLAGMIIAAAYLLIRHKFDRRISSTTAVEQETGLAVVGTLPIVEKDDAEQRLITSGGGNDRGNSNFAEHAMAEALRELRTNLQFMNIDNPPRMFVITSALPGEGKSTVTANLAVTIAASGQRVVIIDGDLRRPTVAKTFNLIEGVGLTDVLLGRAEIEDVLQPWEHDDNLVVLGSGKLPPNPSELLGSDAFHNIITELAAEHVVLIDAPPLLPVTDAAILTARTHGALVVSRVGKTNYEALNAAIANLSRVNAEPLGLILNGTPLKGEGSRNYGYGYGYHSYYHATDSVELSKNESKVSSFDSARRVSKTGTMRRRSR